jgi:hypothetical protein
VAGLAWASRYRYPDSTPVVSDGVLDLSDRAVIGLVGVAPWALAIILFRRRDLVALGARLPMSSTYAVLVVGAGLLANLLIAAMFVARVVVPKRARTLGFAGTAMAIPLAGASIVAIRERGDVWAVVLPLVFVVFAVVEVTIDLILDIEFRTTVWLWPYLMLFYVAQWAVIGAAFRVSEIGGFVVLVSYFICLAATAYSYRRVGHGRAEHRGPKISAKR